MKPTIRCQRDVLTIVEETLRSTVQGFDLGQCEIGDILADVGEVRIPIELD
jgi:hypothetical protein